MGEFQESETNTEITSALTAATHGISAPVSVVDLSVFDANARTLATRAHGKPIRIATKSVRNRTLIDRALALPGYQGLMCYSLPEALWLVDLGHTDILVAYPCVDRAALDQLASNSKALAEIVLIVDCLEHFEILEQTSPIAPIKVALDIDSSLRIFSRTSHPIHVGVRRSNLYTAQDVRSLLNRTEHLRSSTVVGAMFYDAQIAGLPDTSFALRTMKRLSRSVLSARRKEITQLLTSTCGPLQLVNAGGTGSISHYQDADEVTEVTAGSGLYHPSLFDGYRGLGLRPSAYFGVDVVRAPRPNIVTAFAGGYMASGQVAVSRQPKPVNATLKLTHNEGVGEVQTRFQIRRGAAVPRIGDRIWLRHAKAGEQMERFNQTYLFDGTQIVGSAQTYRGEGKNFG